MLVKLWGVRGSLGSPLSNEEYNSKIHSIIEQAIASDLNDNSQIDKFLSDLPDELRCVYGGNTTCISVTSKSGKMYIVDCGSGIRPLGYELMKGPCGKGEGIVDIFLTHNHWDHIQGLPFFTPIYIPGNVINFHSPYKNQNELLSNQMRPPYFPATFEETPSIKNFTLLNTKNITPIKLEDDLEIDYYPLKHPCGSYAYRFKQNNKTFIFATDAEFTGETLEKVDKNNHFFTDADLLVIDSQYTLDESFTKFDWGHTSYTMAINCGLRWNTKNIVLTHHEPAYSDSDIQKNYIAAVEHRENSGNHSLNIYMAKEGMTFEL